MGIKDVAAFRQCVEKEETAAIVQSGVDLARELRIDAIPTFIINGKLVSGALSEQRLERLVQEALAEVE